MDQPRILGVTDVTKELGLTFFRWEKYRELGLVQAPDTYAGKREFWYPASVLAIKESIERYEESVRQAVRNELRKQAQVEREAEEAHQARRIELGEMYKRNAEAVGI